MPTSPTGICNSRVAPAAMGQRLSSGGFTLIEIIVVVLIVGVIVSFASLALRGSADDVLQREAERLALLMRNASDLAVMRSREYGLLLDEQAYVFLELGDDGWRLPSERAFGLHELPDSFKLTLRSEGTEIVARPIEQEGPTVEEQPEPQVLMMSNADITPFEIELSAYDTETRWRLALDERGTVALETLE